MQNYIIYPYIGFGDLRFGMSQQEAHTILGPPNRKKKSRFSEEYTEYWQHNWLQLVFSEKDEKLLEIGVYPKLGTVTLNNIDIFGEPGNVVYNALVELDGEPFNAFGGTLFLNLGIGVIGFLCDDDNDKAVSVFNVDRWSKDDPLLVPASK